MMQIKDSVIYFGQNEVGYVDCIGGEFLAEFNLDFAERAYTASDFLELGRLMESLEEL